MGGGGQHMDVLWKEVTNKGRGRIDIRISLEFHITMNKTCKVFGSLSITLIPTIKWSKLNYKVEKGYFVGYSSMSKGYILYNIKS